MFERGRQPIPNQAALRPIMAVLRNISLLQGGADRLNGGLRFASALIGREA
jgi:hypothetical protein